MPGRADIQRGMLDRPFVAGSVSSRAPLTADRGWPAPHIESQLPSPAQYSHCRPPPAVDALKMERRERPVPRWSSHCSWSHATRERQTPRQGSATPVSMDSCSNSRLLANRVNVSTQPHRCDLLGIATGRSCTSRGPLNLSGRAERSISSHCRYARRETLRRHRSRNGSFQPSCVSSFGNMNFRCAGKC